MLNGLVREDKLALDLLLREKARRSLLSFVLHTKPDYSAGWFHHEVCRELDQFLQDVLDKKSPRLMLFAPPRHGKSELVSRRFPAFAFGRNPDLKIIATSYSSDLSSAMNRDVQRVIDQDEYHELFPETTLSGSAVRTVTSKGAFLRNSENFEIVGHKGEYKSAGVGTGVTGRGGHCFPAGTLVQTSIGPVFIEDLNTCPSTVRVLSFNHTEARLEWKRIQGFSVRKSVGLRRITTAAGRVVVATLDHPFYSAGRYVEARDLAPGDPLLRLVQSALRCGSVRAGEEHGSGLPGSLLLGGVLREASCNEEQQSVRSVRRGGGSAREGMLAAQNEEGARHGSTGISSYQSGVSYMQRCVHGGASWARSLRHLLFQGLRRSRALTAHERAGQSEMEGRSHTGETATALCEGVSCDAATDSRAGRARLRGLSQWRLQAGSASLGQRPDELRCIEPCDALLQVSSSVACCEGFQAIEDSVAMVEDLCEEASVYDLQIEDNHNFFSEDILAHNCLIIDDPIKDAQEAYSQTTRDGVWNWYTSTLYTRCEPGGGILIILTRWHEDDLAGRILKQMERGGEQWKVIRYPAVAEENEKYRDKGEALHPDRYPITMLDNIRLGTADESGVGSRVWTALYQQRPSAADGTIFRREHWSYHKTTAPLQLDNDPVKALKTLLQLDQIIQYWDTAAGGKQGNDYSCCATLGISKNRYYMLDLFKEKVEFPDLVRAVQQQFDKWHPSKVGVEGGGSSSGKSVIQTLSRTTKIPFQEVVHATDKVLRANVISPIQEAGLVSLPEGAGWVADFINSCGSFPNTANDDDVDSLMGALEMATQKRKPMQISEAALTRMG